MVPFKLLFSNQECQSAFPGTLETQIHGPYPDLYSEPESESHGVGLGIYVHQDPDYYNHCANIKKY